MCRATRGGRHVVSVLFCPRILAVVLFALFLSVMVNLVNLVELRINIET